MDWPKSCFNERKPENDCAVSRRIKNKSGLAVTKMDYRGFAKKTGLLSLIAVIAGLLLGMLLFSKSKPAGQLQACFKSHCFLAELAETEEARTQGLMFRKALDENQGMLFVFGGEEIYPFWMKNTLIPLDIIWINKDKKVVFINENSQPCRADGCPAINPEIEAKYVLEIKAGISQKIGLKPGDSVLFEN